MSIAARHQSPTARAPHREHGARWILASPWLIVVFSWPATLLAWYYITLVTDPSGWAGRPLLKYLLALLCLDTVICVVVIRKSTQHARAVLRAHAPVELALARRAWVEALNLPMHTSTLIVALIAITVVPISVYLAMQGSWSIVLFGWTGAAMAGACELTLLFPLVQSSTLPLLRKLKQEHPELRLNEPGAHSPPLRAYFTFGLSSLATVSMVLVGTLIHLRAQSSGAAPLSPLPELSAIALVAGCLGSMAAGIGVQLGLSVMQPLRRLSETMRRFSGDERGVRVGLLQLGEVGALCEGFDDMARALDRSRAVVEEREALLRHSQRFEVMANVTAGFAHEVANPLSCVTANLDASGEEVADVLKAKGALDAKATASLENCAAALADATHAAEQMTYLLRDMRSFSRREASGPVSCDVAALLDGAIRIASGEIRRHGTVIRDYQQCRSVRGSPQRLSQVFFNVLLNAARALSGGGNGEVHASVRQVGDEVEVVISDNGHGIAENSRARIFEALFTAWPSGDGTGLGLHVSKEIVEAHGGRIELHSNPGEGTVVTVRLPAEPPLVGAKPGAA